MSCSDEEEVDRSRTLLLQVLEIRPSIMWDKGKALEFLLESLGTCITTNYISVHVSTIVFTPVFIQYLRITPLS